MIKVRHDGRKVIVWIYLAVVSTTFPFEFDCGTEWAAMALEHILDNALADRIQGIRKDEYESGIKAARKKKSQRRTWFSPHLDK